MSYNVIKLPIIPEESPGIKIGTQSADPSLDVISIDSVLMSPVTVDPANLTTELHEDKQ